MTSPISVRMYTAFERFTLITETAVFTAEVSAAVFVVHETPAKFRGQAVKTIGKTTDCPLPLSARAFFNHMRAAGYEDVERGERGSTEEHLTVTQFKVQAEKQRLEEVTSEREQAEQTLADKQSAVKKQEQILKELQKETKVAKTVALSVQDIEAMGKKAAFSGNITLTPDEADALKRYATNGIIFNAENTRLKEKLESAQRSASIWKQRYEKLNEQYTELKKKAQPYLDALEVAADKVRAFLSALLTRGKDTQEHTTPARRKQQDMEI